MEALKNFILMQGTYNNYTVRLLLDVRHRLLRRLSTHHHDGVGQVLGGKQEGAPPY